MTPKCRRTGPRTADLPPWLVDRAVHDAERVGLRPPAVIVDRARPVAAVVVEFVDRDDLARLRFGNQVVVVGAPPGRRIAAEGAAGKGGIAAGAPLHSQGPHRQAIA